MDQRIENTAEHLIKNDIRPSFQRIKILDYLINNQNHPTVDQIYQEVVKEIPTLSKTTVYNTLTRFVEAKILKGLHIEENEIRYDLILFNHGHFKCKQCGEIYDFPIDIDQFQSDQLKTFKIEEKGVYFKGICPQCLKNKKEG